MFHKIRAAARALRSSGGWALAGAVVLLISCADSAGITGPSRTAATTASVAFDSRIVYYGAPHSDPINYIRAKVYDDATGAQIGVIEQSLDPSQNSFGFSLPIALPGARGTSATMTLELANRTPDEVVQYSGRLKSIHLMPGDFKQIDIDLYPGPLDNLDVTGVAIHKPIADQLVGDSVQATASVTGGDAKVRIAWSSLDAKIATVDPASGIIHGVAPGQARIVAAVGRFADTATATVKPRLGRIVISPDSMHIAGVGNSATYKATVFDGNGVERDSEPVTWSVENPRVASMGAPGVFQADSMGSTHVSVSPVADPSLVATAILRVTRANTATLTLTPADTTVTSVGATVPFHAIAKDANGNAIPDVPLTWNSSDTAVAKLADGTATAVNNGQSTIAVTADSVTAHATLHVALAATALRLVSGDQQTGTAGAAAPQPVVARVVDALGQGVAGITVTFAAAEGSVSPASAVSDASGNASSTWTFGGSVGAQHATASANGLTGNPVQFNATVSAASATKLALVTPPSDSATSRVAFARQPVTQLRDRFDNPVATAGVVVTGKLAVAATDSLSGTTATTDAQGRATFTDMTLRGRAGDKTVRFSAPGTDTAAAPVHLGAGPAAILTIVSGGEQSGTAGSSVATTPVLLVTDLDGNPIAGVDLAISVTGGGSVPSLHITTGADGKASVGTWTLGTSAGSDTLTISGTNVTPVRATATSRAGAATHLVITGTSTQVAGTPQTVTITAFDAHGNVDSTYAGDKSIVLSGPDSSAAGNKPTATDHGSAAVAMGTATSLRFTNGVASTSMVLYDAESTEVAATDGNISAAGTDRLDVTVTVGAADAHRTTVSMSPTSVQPGGASTITVTVRDAFGNVITSATPSDVTLSVDGGVTGTVTCSAGICTAPYTAPTTAGTFHVHAKIGGTDVTDSPVAVVVGTGAASASNTAATVPGGTSGAPTTITITVKDSHGNPVGGAAGDLAVTISGSNAGATVGTITETATPGTYTVTYTPITAGADHVAITLAATAISGSAYSSVVSAGTATQLALERGDGQTATAGSAVSTAPAVIAKDAHGNPVSGVSVTFAVASGGGSVTAGSATTGSDGMASVGTWTLGTTAGANTVTATSSGLAGSPVTFSATGTAGAGDASRTTATVPNGTAGNVTTITIAVKDASNNPVTGVAANLGISLSGANVGAHVGTVTETATPGTYTASYTPTVAGTDHVAITLSSTAISGSAYTSVVSAGAATTVKVETAADGSGAVVSAQTLASGNTLTVYAIGRDANGNFTGNLAADTWSLTSITGSVVSGDLVAAADKKSATLTGKLVGSASIEAASGVLAKVSSGTITVSAGTASQLAFSQQPTNTSAGATINAVKVNIEDAAGNVVTSATDNLTIAIGTGSGTLSGTKTEAAVAGVATFADLSINAAATGYTLTASATLSGTAKSATSSSFNITTGSGDASKTTATVPNGIAGSTTTITIAVKDASNNPVTGASSGLAITLTGANAGAHVGTITETATPGTYTATYTPTVAGTDHVAITLSSTAISGSAYTSVVSAGAAASVKVETAADGSGSVVSAQTLTSGNTLTVYAIGRDANGNFAGNLAADNWALTSITGGVVSGDLVAAADKKSATLTGKLVGSASIEAASGSLTQVSSGTITVSAGAASQLVFSQQPSNTAAGATISAVKVNIEDAAGNVVTSATDNVTIAIGTGSGTLSGTKTEAAVTGIGTFADLSINTAATGYTLTASATLGGASRSVTSSSFKISTSTAAASNTTATVPNGAAGSTTTVTILVKDSEGNAVSGMAGSLAVNVGGANASAHFGTITESATPGTYTATYTPTIAGTDHVAITLSGTAISGSAYTSVVSAGAAASVKVETAADGSGSVVSAQTLASGNTLTVYAIGRDANGNFTGNLAADSWALTSITGGVVSGDLVAAADKKSATLTGKLAGSTSIEAASGALTKVSSGTITIAAGAASQLAFSEQPSNTVAGATIGAVKVSIEDAAGNVVTSATNNVTIAIGTGSGTLSGTKTVAPTSGVATFSDLSINAAATGYTLVASGTLGGSSKSATSSSFNITTGSGDASKTTATVPNGTAGSATTITIAVKDASNNAVTDVAADLAIALTGANAGATVSSVTESATPGTYAATYTPTVAGTDHVAITLSSTAISGSSYTSVVSAGAAASVKVETAADGSGSVVTAQTLTSGNTLTVYAIGRDAHGNFTGNLAADNWSLTSITGGVVSGDLVAAADKKSATLTGKLVGSASIEAANGALTKVSSGTITVSAGAASQLAFSQQPTNTSAGATISAVKVKIEDAAGNVVTSATDNVTIAIGTGSGTLSGTKTEPAVAGVATFADLSINTSASGYTLSATATLSGSSKSARSSSFNITTGSGDASKTLATVPNGTAGSITTITIAVKDASNNPVTGAAGDLAISLSGANASAHVGTITESATPGTYTATYTPTVAGTDHVAITLSSTAISGSAYTSVVSAGAATTVEVETAADGTGSVASAQTLTSGNTLTVYAIGRDANGNFTGNLAADSWSLASITGGVVSGDLVAAADKKSATLTGKLVGSANIEAASGALTKVSSGTITIAAGAASQLAFSQQPSNTVAGATMGAVKVSIEDAAGNVVTSATDNVTIAIGTGSGTLSGTKTEAAVSGIATFADLSINTAATGYTLAGSATLGGTAKSATSSSFDITTGTGDASRTTATVPNGTAGSATTITISVKDASGNPVTGVAASLAIGLSGANAGAHVGTITESATNGTYTATYTPTIAGSDHVAITLSGTAISGSAYTSVVSAGAATTVKVETAADGSGSIVTAQTLTSGNTLTVYAISRDANGNFTGNLAADSWSLTSITGGVVSGDLVTAADKKSATLTGKLVGSASIGATSGSLTNVSSGTITVAAGAASQIAFSQQPSNTAAGATISAVKVNIQDAAGNVVTTAADNVAIAIGTGSGTLSGTKTVAPTSGVATFSDLSINAAANGYTLSATATLSGSSKSATSSSFNIISSTAAASNTTATVPNATAGSLTTITIAVKDASNNPVTGVAGDLAIALTGSNAGATVSSITETATPGTYTATYTPTVAGTDHVAITLSSTAISGSAYTSVVSAGAATTVKVETAADGSGSVVSAETLTSGNTLTVYAIGRDANGNFTGNLAADSWSLTSITGGVVSGDLVAAADKKSATLTGKLVGSASIEATSASLTKVSSGTITIVAGAASQLAFSQQPTNTAAGAIMSAVKVNIEDAAGNVVTSATDNVTIAIGTGAGTLSGTKTEAPVSGIATFADLSINAAANGYTLSATATLSGSGKSATSSSFNITTGSGDASKTTATVPNGIAGSTTTITIAVKDASNNPVTGASSDLAITLTGANAGATVSSITETVTPGTYTATYTPTVAGTDHVAITLSSTAISGSSYTSVVSAGAATTVKVETAADGTGSVVTAQTLASGNTLTVYAIGRDAHGNFTGNLAADSWALTSITGGVVTGDLAASADKKSATLTGKLVGSASIEAASGSLTKVSSGTITIGADTGSQLAFSQQPSNTAAGATISAVKVNIEDAAGNVVTTAADNVTIAVGTGSGTLSGTKTEAAVTGIASFADLSINTAATGYTLTASATLGGSSKSATSSSFNITTSTAAASNTTATVPNGTAGSITTITIAVKDASNNPVTGVAASLAISLSGANAGAHVGTITESATSGTYTATYTPTVAGTDHVAITLSGTAISGSAYTSAVSAGAATTVQVETAADGSGSVVSAQTLTSGNTLTVYAIGRDANGNFTGNLAADTWALTSITGGVVSGDLAASADKKSATLTGKLAGSASIQATSGALIGGTSGTITVTAAAVASVKVETAADGSGSVVGAQTLTSGSTLTVYAIGRDVNGNFTGNLAADSWSLASITGGVVSGDLAASADKKSATLTAKLVGSASIEAASGSLTKVSSGTITIAAGAASQLAFSQQPSNTAAGATISAVKVNIEDAVGNVVTSATDNVTIAIGTGSGTLSGTKTEAAVAGVASFADLSVNVAGTGYTLSATATLGGSSKSATSSSFNITTGSGAASATTATVPNGTAGSSTTITIAVKDASNNPVAGVASDLAIALTGSNAGATVSSITESATPGTYTATYTPTVAGTDHVAITLSSTAISGSAYTSVVSAGVATSARVETAADGSGSVVTAQALTSGNTLTVYAIGRDANGNFTGNMAADSWSLTSITGGVVNGDLVAAADKKSATLTGKLVGSASIEAASGALTKVSSGTITIVAGAASQLAFSQQPSNTAAGATISAVKVNIEDAAGNVATTATDNVTIAIGTGSGTLSGTKTEAAVSGIATFADLSINAAATGYTLSATATLSGSSKSATSSSFNITTGSGDASKTTATVPNGTAGSVTTITIAVKDASNNPVTGVAGDLAIALTGANAGATLSSITESATLGTYTATYRPTIAGTDQVAITLSSTAISGSAYTSVVSAGAATSVRVETAADGSGSVVSAQTLASGSTLTVYAIGRDANGNFTGNLAADSWTLTSINGGVSAGDLVASAGNKSATLTGKLVGSASIEATSASLTKVSSGTITIAAGAASQLAFSQQPTNTSAGATISAVKVNIEDAAGNVVTTATNDVTIAVGTGSGTLSGTKTEAAVSGVASFADLSINTAATGYTLSASATLGGASKSVTSSSFDIATGSGDASKTSATVPNGTAGSVTTLTIAVKDASNNPVAGVASDLAIALTGSNAGATVSGITETATPGTYTATYTPTVVGTDHVAITLSSTAISGSSYASVVSAGAATTVKVETAADGTGSVVTAQTLTSGNTLTVYAIGRDAHGNFTGNLAADTWALTSITGGVVSGDLVAAADKKSATLTGKLVGSASIEATSASLTTVSSGTITIAAGAASQLAFSQQPTNTAAGATISAVKVSVEDAAGNVVTTATNDVTIAVGTGSGTLSGTKTEAAVAGVASFADLSVNVAGTGYTLSATATLSGSSKSATSSSFNITTGSGDASKTTATVPDGTAGSVTTITIAVNDASNNPVTGVAGDLAIAITGANAGVTPSSITESATSGTYTATYTPTVAGTDHVAITLSSTAISGSAYTSVVSAGAATTVKVETAADGTGSVVTAQTLMSGNTLTVYAIGRDAHGNFTGNLAADSWSLTGITGGVVSGDLAASADKKSATLTGKLVGSASIEATSGALTKVSSGTVTISAGAASQLAFSQQPSNTAAGATISAVKVNIEDAAGNVVTTATDNVTIAIGTGSGTLSGTKTEAAVSGTATFADLSINTAATGYTLAASATLSGSSKSATSTSFDITAGSAASFALNAPADIVAGTRAAYTVTRKDADGNLVTSGAQTVHLTATGGTFYDAATNGSTISQVTIADGQSSANFWYTHTLVGSSYTVSASDASPADGATGIADATDDIGVTAAAASQIVFGQQPTNVVAGATMSPAVTARIEDQYGNLTASTSTVHLSLGTNPASATLGVTLSHAAVAGVATFSDLTLNKVGTGYTIVASDAATPDGATGLADATSSAFNVTVGTADATQSSFAASPTSVTVGGTTTLTLTVLDAHGNPVTTITPSDVSITETGGPLGSIGTVSCTNGVCTATYTAGTTSGTAALHAAVGGTDVTGSPLSLPVNAGAVDHFALSGAATQVAGTAQTVTIKALDAHENVVTSFAGDQAITLSGANSIGSNNPTATDKTPAAVAFGTATTLTFSNGQATTAVVLYKQESALLVATQSSITTTGTNRLSVAVSSANATALGITTQPTGATVATALTTQPVVQLRDAYGNTVAVADSAITASVNLPSGATGTLGGSATVHTDASGVASFTGLSITGTAMAGYTITFTASLNGASRTVVSDPFALAAGNANKLVVTTGPPTSSASAAAISPALVVQVQDAGGNRVAGSTASIQATLTVPGGATGSLSGTTTVSADTGVAAFSNLIPKGTAASGYTLTFASSGLTSATTGVFALVAGDPTQLVILTQPSSTANSGETLVQQPEVELRDAANNVVKTAGVTVLAVLTVPDTSTRGTLLGTTTANTNANGDATFSSLAISGQNAKSYTLSFYASTDDDNLLTSPTSNSILLAAGAATHLSITIQPPTSTTNGNVLSPTPVVQLRDASNDPVALFGSTITVTSSCGTLSGTTSTTTDDGGTAYFDNLILSGTAPSSCTLTFSSSGLTSVTSNAMSIQAGAAANVAQNGSFTTSATVGTALTTMPSVKVTDAGGNAVSNVTVNFVKENGGGTLTGTTQTTDANGIATLGGWTFDNTAGVHTILAVVDASDVSGSPLRFSSTAVAGAASTIAIAEGNNQTAQAGTAVAIAPSVIVKDSFGNTVSGATVAVSVATGGGSVNPTTSMTTNSSGVATVTSWTLGTTAGTNNQTLTATINGSTSVTFTASATAGAAARIAASGTTSASNIAAGTAVTYSPTVKVTDANGNPVSGYTVQFIPSTGSGSVSQSVATTDASGLANAGTWTSSASTAVSAQTVKVTDAALTGSPITFTANVVTNPNANPASIIVTASANSVAPSATLTVTGQLKDASGNSLSKSGVPITWTSSASGSWLSTTSSTSGCAASVQQNTDGNGQSKVWVCTTTAGTSTITGTDSSDAVTASVGIAVTGGTLANNTCKTLPNTCLLKLNTASMQTVRTDVDSVVVNESTTPAITLQLLDGTGSPIAPGTSGSMVFTWASPAIVGSTAVTVTHGDETQFSATGYAAASFPAPATTGVYKVSVSYLGSGSGQGRAFASDTIIFNVVAPSSTSTNTASAATSTVSATPTSLAADGSSTSAISIQLKDASGTNTTNGSISSVTVSGGTISNLAAGLNGAYTATFTSSTTAGTAVVTPVLASGGSFASSALITKTASKYELTMSQNGVSVAAGTALAQGTVVRVTARMQDGAGNYVTSVTGGSVTWSSTGTGGSFSSGTSTVSNGVATVDFTVGSTSHTITATDSRYSYALTGSVTTGSVTPPDHYNISLSNPNPYTGETITVTAQLVDASNNPVSSSGRTINWTATTDGITNLVNTDATLGMFSSLTSTTNSTGAATVSFTASSVGFRTQTVRATDAIGASPICGGSQCTGVSADFQTGVTLVGLPSNAPANSQSQSITFTYPSGVRAGDLIVVALDLSNSGGGDPSTATVTDAGWTQYQKLDNVAGQLSMRVLYRIATGSESGSVTLNLSNKQRVGGSLMVYRNADTSNPIVNAQATIQTTPQTGTAPFALTAPATVTTSTGVARVLTLLEHSASGSNRIFLPSGAESLFLYDGSNSSGGQYTVISGSQSFLNAASATVPAFDATNTAAGMYIAVQLVIPQVVH